MASLNFATTKGRDFLAFEVEKSAAGSSNERYDHAWTRLDKGDVEAAIHVLDSMAISESQNEKVWLTRAIAHTRAGLWSRGLADYSRYLELTRSKNGSVFANAQYGRAICFAKMDYPLDALQALDACIKAGPGDEQMSDSDASLAPRAVVARCLLLQDNALKQKYSKTSTSIQEEREAEETTTPPASAVELDAYYNGAVWHAPVTKLEEAISHSLQVPRTPLLLDPLPEHPAETYYLYREATIVDAKKLVVEVKISGTGLDEARERLRSELVHALRWGHTLFVRMANTAADFVHSYCSADHFPVELFDCSILPSGKELCIGGSSPFCRILRDQDVKQTAGRLLVPASFRVVVCSTFNKENYASLLGDSLPLAHLQPVLILAAASEDGPENVLGAPKSQQLQGDRTTLFLQS